MREQEQAQERKNNPNGDMIILHDKKGIYMAENRRMAILTIVIPCVQKCKLDLSLAHCSYTCPDIQERFLNLGLNISVESDSWAVYW